MINYKIKKVNKNGEEKEKIKIDVYLGVGTTAYLNSKHTNKRVEMIEVDYKPPGSTNYVVNVEINKEINLIFDNVDAVDRMLERLFEIRKGMTE